jgi:hypothetical protein
MPWLRIGKINSGLFPKVATLQSLPLLQHYNNIDELLRWRFVPIITIFRHFSCRQFRPQNIHKVRYVLRCTSFIWWTSQCRSQQVCGLPFSNTDIPGSASARFKIVCHIYFVLSYAGRSLAISWWSSKELWIWKASGLIRSCEENFSNNTAKFMSDVSQSQCPIDNLTFKRLQYVHTFIHREFQVEIQTCFPLLHYTSLQFQIN